MAAEFVGGALLSAFLQVAFDRLASRQCESQKNLSVISVVSMGGMGKTTLAQLVYNDGKIKDEFEVRVWVCVTEEFDVFKVTRTVLEQITMLSDDTKDLNMLQLKLKEELMGKKFLLVLDDVWNENYLNWEVLQSPFIYGAPGSKILVTTRSEKVASTMRCAKPHHLNHLSEEDSWSLFAKHALHDRDSCSNSGFEEIGRKVVKKCKGLPLALKTIGSLLYTKMSSEEWNGILTSEIWDLSEEEINIIPALRLSYQYLPSHLKRCFAYCSLLPKDYEFDKDYLVQLWMDENLLQFYQQNKSMKEIGDECFNDLLSRSFFQRSSGDTTQFVMHDLINDLAKCVSGQFCLRLEEDEDVKKVRKMPLGLGKLKNLEVLSSYYVGRGGESNITELAELNLRGSLHVEELQNVVHPMDALSANFRNKVHLEKLSLTWSMNNGGSQKERDVLEKLQPHTNLKRLCINNYSGTRFPDWFGNNHLCNIVSMKLINCKYCFILPPLGILSSLKELCIKGLDGIVVIGPEFYGNNSSAPFGSLQVLKIKKMVELEEWECERAPEAFPCLEVLYIKDCEKLRKQLPIQLPSLQRLEITNCRQLVSSLPLVPAIDKLQLKNCGNLKWKSFPFTLKTLRIGGSCMEKSLLENLHEMMLVHTCLKSFTVGNCPRMEFPVGHSLAFLAKVYILDSCDALRTFQLDLFPKLVSLKLHGCRNFERFSTSEGHHLSLNSLATLEIHRCPKLRSLPKGFTAPKLEVLDISQLESLTSLPDHMHILFPSLRSMALANLEVESFPEGSLPSNLRSLVIRFCPKLMASRMKWNLNTTSLVSLVIIDENMQCFPDKCLLPPALEELHIQGCSNLQTFDHEGLCHLASLKLLSVVDCPKLEGLPKKGLPSSLGTLAIRGNCPLIKQRCQKQSGKDIPWVEIDDEIIM
ncbi:hypothetical protein RJT34_27361 [Clitoria ternatea]|uniref:NB-ARC domain-containing protein n=1 Tax=Clitoria ternatea TaxID=43366 RepID=A0AAN9F9R6_CLITE